MKRRTKIALALSVILTLAPIQTTYADGPLEFESSYLWMDNWVTDPDVGFMGWVPEPGNDVTPYVMTQNWPTWNIKPGLGAYPVGGKVYLYEGYWPGKWTFTAPGTTTIKEARFKNLFYRNHQLPPELGGHQQGHFIRLGLWDPTPPPGSWADTFDDPSPDPEEEGEVEPLLGVDKDIEDDDGDSKYAVFWFGIVPCVPEGEPPPGDEYHDCRWIVPGWNQLHSPYAWVNGVELTLIDNEQPSIDISGLLHDLQNQWLRSDKTYPININATDPGSGMQTLTLSYTDSEGTEDEIASVEAECDENHTANPDGRICPVSLSSDNWQVNPNDLSIAQGEVTFKVEATDYAGHTQEQTFTAFVDTDPPPAPENLTLEPDDGKVALSWDPVQIAQGSPLDHYGVSYSVDEGTSWTTPQMTTKTQKLIQDIPVGTKVDVKLDATDKAGWNSDAAGASTAAYNNAKPSTGANKPPKISPKPIVPPLIDVPRKGGIPRNLLGPYTHPYDSCNGSRKSTANRIDPINVVFYGPGSGIANVKKTIDSWSNWGLPKVDIDIPDVISKLPFIEDQYTIWLASRQCAYVPGERNHSKLHSMATQYKPSVGKLKGCHVYAGIKRTHIRLFISNAGSDEHFIAGDAHNEYVGVDLYCTLTPYPRITKIDIHGDQIRSWKKGRTDITRHFPGHIKRRTSEWETGVRQESVMQGKPVDGLIANIHVK